MYVSYRNLPMSLTPCLSFRLQGAKAQQKRERNAGKAANTAKSQTKTNQAAMNIVCTVCRQAFVSLRLSTCSTCDLTTLPSF